jgi:hypothetical protein
VPAKYVDPPPPSPPNNLIWFPTTPKAGLKDITPDPTPPMLSSIPAPRIKAVPPVTQTHAIDLYELIPFIFVGLALVNALHE